MTVSANALRESFVFGDEARGRRPRSSHRSRRNSGVAGRGHDRTSGGHAGGRRREHRQPPVLLPMSGTAEVGDSSEDE